MPIGETLLGAIADAVFGYIIDTFGEHLTDIVREKLGHSPTKAAFKRALKKAVEVFEKQHPEWVVNYFDASFFQNEGAPILAQFLLRDRHPNPSELAARWAASLPIKNNAQRTLYTRELEPVAAEFLNELGHALKAQPALRELQDSRAFEQLASDVRLIRQQLQAEQATPGTKRDYLRWLIARNSYIDIRGTMQTHQQIQVKLDQVYISLQAYSNPPIWTKAVSWLTLDRMDSKQVASQFQSDVDILLQLPDRKQFIQAKSFSSSREFLLADFLDYAMSVQDTSPQALQYWGENLTHFSQEASYRLYNLILSAFHRISPAWRFSLQPEILKLEVAVSFHDRLLLLGDPGSGKTTLLRYLALKHAQALITDQKEAGPELGETRFPILIRIADYAEESIWKREALSDFLAKNHALRECPARGLANLFQMELNQGHCLVLLDGLDEIVNADDRRGIVERIDNFVRRYGELGNRFVITSRIAGYESVPLGEPFARYTIREMDEQQIHSFLERWCQAVENAQTPDLPLDERKRVAQREVQGIMKAVHANPGVHHLATNPLLLRTLVLIHRTGAQLPQKRIELYHLAADTLARTWRTAQGVPESALADETYLTRLLGKLAYWMHLNKPAGIASEQEVIRELGQEWARLKGLAWDEDQPDIEKEVRRFLQQVQVHTGLLVERAPKRYGFLHLTFEEYYAARYLVARSRTRVQLIRKHLHDPRWEEPILLALGFVGLSSPDDASELLETAILAQGEEALEYGFTSSLYEDLLGRDFRFAVRCLGDNIPVDAPLLQQLIGRLANELLHLTGRGQFAHYRQALEENLRSLRESQAGNRLFPVLLQALRDQNPGVRIRAMRSLMRLDPRSVHLRTALVRLVSTDPYQAVRRIAIQTLSQLEPVTPEILTTLQKALRDKDPWVRCEAACALWQLKQWQLVPTILTVIQDASQSSQQDENKSPDFSIFVESIWNSLIPTSPEAVMALIALLAEQNTEIRATAASLLKRTPRESISLALPALHAALAESHFPVRFQAAASLAYLSDPSTQVIHILLDPLRKQEQASLRWQAIEALGHVKEAPPEVEETLLRCLTREPKEVSPEAIVFDAEHVLILATLGKLHRVSPATIVVLAQTLQQSPYPPGEVATQSLGILGRTHPKAVDALLQALDKGDVFLRAFAAQALGLVGNSHIPEEVIVALHTALHDADEEVCCRAAKSLAQFGQRVELATLFEIIHAGYSKPLCPSLFLLVDQASVQDEATRHLLIQALPIFSTDVSTCQDWIAVGEHLPFLAEPLAARLLPAPEAIIRPDERDAYYEAIWQLLHERGQ